MRTRQKILLCPLLIDRQNLVFLQKSWLKHVSLLDVNSYSYQWWLFLVLKFGLLKFGFRINSMVRGLNQSPRGIMRSAVPLLCFFNVVKSQKVAGQRLQ